MTLGEKIRNLRNAKMMTQSELAGTVITRNMLSQIENGAAMPSLPTLMYLADKLKVPAGYLIADDESELIYRKISCIDNVKRAYSEGEYRICRSICLNELGFADDELSLILAGCSLNIGKELFEAGKIRAACAAFDEAIRYCASCAYYTKNIVSEIAVYYRYLNRKISHTIYSEEVLPPSSDGLAFSDPFCKYIIACEAIESGQSAMASYIVDSLREGSGHLHLILQAKSLMREQEYTAAAAALQEVLRCDIIIVSPLLYDILCDLEVCCKEISDYKHAYEYSSNKMTVIEKMLSDDGYID